MGLIILGEVLLTIAKIGLIFNLINADRKAEGPKVSSYFSPVDTCLRATHGEADKNQIRYTIQICTLDYPIDDPFIGGKNKIRIIRIGDVYRYIFSMYKSLEEARKDLPVVRAIYPGAYIREYYGGKLGKAYDIIFDHSEYKNTTL